MILQALLLFLIAGSAQAQVYRCGNTYQSAPCTGGKVVDASPAVADPAGAKTVLVYLCKDNAGGLWWIPNACSGRGWTTERFERVPAGIPWEHQLAIAKGQRDAAQRDTAPPVMYGNAPPSPYQQKKARCAALDEEVKRYDEMGRQGSQRWNLEWVREQRRKARDAQFNLRC
jgi:hypothetical protein